MGCRGRCRAGGAEGVWRGLEGGWLEGLAGGVGEAGELEGLEEAGG